MLGKSITAWAISVYGTLQGSFEDGAIYQTWFSFPRSKGVYETFTCTQKYRANGKHEMIGVENYLGKSSFEVGASTGRYNNVNMADEIDASDWNFAGWQQSFSVDGLALPQIELQDGEIGCGAMRVFEAVGSLMPTIEKRYGEEVDWIRGMDWRKTQKVKSGWKKWSGPTDNSPEGADSDQFKLDINCPACL